MANTYISAFWSAEYSPAFHTLCCQLSSNRSVFIQENRTIFCNFLNSSCMVLLPPPLTPTHHTRVPQLAKLQGRSRASLCSHRPCHPRGQLQDGRATLVCSTANRNTRIYPPCLSPGPYAVPIDKVSLVRLRLAPALLQGWGSPCHWHPLPMPPASPPCPSSPISKAAPSPVPLPIPPFSVLFVKYPVII